MITFEDNLVYSQDLVSRNRDDLFRLGVFRTIQIFPQFIDDTNFVRPIINLGESPKWSTTVGVGYGQDERFRTQLRVAHHNVLNRADQQILTVRTTYIEPWDVQFTWRQPAFLSRRLVLTVTPSVRRKIYRNEDDEIEFVHDRTGNVTGISYPFHHNWTVRLSHSLTQNNMPDIRIAEDERMRAFWNQSKVYSEFDINLSFPRRNPHRGIRFISGADYSGLGFGSPFKYYALSQEIRYYQPVYDYFVLAGRASIQTMEEIGDTPPIPIVDRLRLGGMQSVRGWRRNSITPLDADGAMIGGRSALFFNLESRIPLSDTISSALLYDAGQVYYDSYQFDGSSLLHSVGIGFRYTSPIGIIRLDLARAVPDQRATLQWYLSIGESF